MIANLKIFSVAGALMLGFAALGCGRATGQTSVPEAGTIAQRGQTDGPYGFSRRAITGAPYSAHVESTMTQTLADGTTITHRFGIINMFRDSQGRERRELFAAPAPGQADSDELISITIYDRSAGENYVLNPRNHTVQEMGRTRPLRTGLDDATARIAAVNPGAVPPIPGVADGSAGGILPNITSESIGEQEMEGLVVEGRRETMEYPTGSAGNDHPFSVVTEKWESRELHLLVYSKRTDPRSGETVMHVTNIDRHEQAASLFQVPADYTITKEETVPVDQQ
jgi:hypothetical protein